MKLFTPKKPKNRRRYSSVKRVTFGVLTGGLAIGLITLLVVNLSKPRSLEVVTLKESIKPSQEVEAALPAPETTETPVEAATPHEAPKPDPGTAPMPKTQPVVAEALPTKETAPVPQAPVAPPEPPPPSAAPMPPSAPTPAPTSKPPEVTVAMISPQTASQTNPKAELPASPPKADAEKLPTKKSDDGEFVLIDAVTAVIGDSLDGSKNALPHRVRLSPYWIGRHEVSFELWEKVVKWGRDHGYVDLPDGLGKMKDHPLYGISWHEAARWCNARSEMEGLTPCYYENQDKQEVMRKGSSYLNNRCVRWEANGYRLPTEAEWEVAARGGLEGKRFPWGDTITHENANYYGALDTPYDKSGRAGPPATFLGPPPHTAPIGSFPPNGFGLYDMSGNVSEWCWDYSDPFFGDPELAKAADTATSLSLPISVDPKGPDTGSHCVVRGGGWRFYASEACCASRDQLPGMVPAVHVGFRLARRP